MSKNSPSGVPFSPSGVPSTVRGTTFDRPGYHSPSGVPLSPSGVPSEEHKNADLTLSDIDSVGDFNIDRELVDRALIGKD